MKPITSILLLLLLIACNNQQVTEEETGLDTTKTEHKKAKKKKPSQPYPPIFDEPTRPLFKSIHHAPFTYSCNDELSVGVISLDETDFKDTELEGLLYAGELLLENQCADREYHLFFGVSEIFWPLMNVRINGESDTLFELFNSGCSNVEGITDNSFLVDEDGIITIIGHTHLNSKEEEFDTTYIDLKKWCE